jgi:hypothetical protein
MNHEDSAGRNCANAGSKFSPQTGNGHVTDVLCTQLQDLSVCGWHQGASLRPLRSQGPLPAGSAAAKPPPQQLLYILWSHVQVSMYSPAISPSGSACALAPYVPWLLQVSRRRVPAKARRTRNALHPCFARFAEPGIALVNAGRKEEANAEDVAAQGLHPARGGWIPEVSGTSPVRMLHR